jgi:protein transport protein SEC61 subunit alpha
MRRVFFNDKLVNTVLAVLFFLVAGEIPIFGIKKVESRVDPLYWMRPMLASKLGTLMEIGVQPVITASMLMQLLYGLNLIELDYRSRQDRNLFNGLQKLFAIFLYFIWAAGSLLAGAYGDLENIGYIKSALIVTQLVFAGVLVVLLDDML